MTAAVPATATPAKADTGPPPSREQLLYWLHEVAEIGTT